MVLTAEHKIQEARLKKRHRTPNCSLGAAAKKMSSHCSGVCSRCMCVHCCVGALRMG